jgi:hypothetical protein
MAGRIGARTADQDLSPASGAEGRDSKRGWQDKAAWMGRLVRTGQLRPRKSLPEAGEASSPYFFSVNVLCPAGGLQDSEAQGFIPGNSHHATRSEHSLKEF